MSGKKTWFITGTSRGLGHEWALEGPSQALAQEVSGSGIKVTLIEPGGYSTDWGGSSARHAVSTLRPETSADPAPWSPRGTVVTPRERRFTP